jgi:predicted Zn-dependent protease
MRSTHIIQIAIAVALSACADTSCLVSSAADAQPCEVAPSTAIRYVTAPAQSHSSRAHSSRVVTVRIDRKFDPYERAKALRAVNEWNHALNGYIRLEMSPEGFDTAAFTTAIRPRLDGWVVAKSDSSHGLLRAPGMRRTLALTLSNHAGAFVLLAADRVGSKDLATILKHEFGHALGAGHDSRSALMHPFYAGDRQGCIDEFAMREVAKAQRMPLEAFNWCGVAQERRVGRATRVDG